MAKLESGYANSVMESRTRKGNNAVPLPYLIRPHKIIPTFKYYSSDDESDEDDPSIKDVETSSLIKGNSLGLGKESNASLSEMGDAVDDEKEKEYVVVDNVEAKTETAGAIQMVELSKDTVAVSDSADAGSKSDDWVVL